MPSDARPKYKLFPPTVQAPQRIEVQGFPGEMPRQAAERYMRGISRRGYYMWEDSPTTFYTWIPGIFDDTIEVIF